MNNSPPEAKLIALSPRCKLVSRNDNEFKSFSSLNAAIAQELKNRSVVLDGEIVCLDNVPCVEGDGLVHIPGSHCFSPVMRS